ncbi:MAG: HEPN domain-containing protein [Phycisphaeraceae bacterium]
MKGSPDVTRGWLNKANHDLEGARKLLELEGPYDLVCFHCQQAVEKYMKGLLDWHGTPFPFTHDLALLGPLCKAADPVLVFANPDVFRLSDYAVKLRYDSVFNPTRDEAAQALAIAQRVCGEIADRLPPNAKP